MTGRSFYFIAPVTLSGPLHHLAGFTSEWKPVCHHGLLFMGGVRRESVSQYNLLHS